jgi:hypothetical protein
MIRLASVVALALITLVVSACGSDDDTKSSTTTKSTTTEAGATTTTEAEPEQPEVFQVTIEDGIPKGGVQRWKVDQGDRVAIVVKSDTEGELHLHGYDVGAPTTLSVVAEDPGAWELEIEDTATPVGTLEVH